MGCSVSNGKVSPNRYMKDRSLVILMLGTSNSGKTTLVKQMKLLHKNGFTDHERMEHACLIIQNICESMFAIVGIIFVDDELHFQDVTTMTTAITLKAMAKGVLEGRIDDFSNILLTVKMLLKDPVIESCVKKHRNDVPNIEAVTYFFNHIDRLCLRDFVPTNDDILHTRLPTSGVNEIEFEFRDQNLVMVDVCGQKTQRNKWTNCFEGVQCILFCVSLEDYARYSKDDRYVNALQESLDVFEWIVNSCWLHNKEILVFLNKKDIFEDLVKEIPLKTFFPDFKGLETNVADSYRYVQELFFSRNKNPRRKIYAHVTCAVDTRNVDLAFCVAMDSIVKRGAANLGLL